MIDIFLPEFTKFPATYWKYIIISLQRASGMEPRIQKIHLPILISEGIQAFRIVHHRLGVILTADKRMAWYHICQPWVLTRRILADKIRKDDPWWELNWGLAHFNELGEGDEWRCRCCFRKLTKPQILMIKAGILDIRT